MKSDLSRYIPIFRSRAAFAADRSGSGEPAAWYAHAWIWMLLAIAAAALRVLPDALHFISYDMRHFLRPWLYTINGRGWEIMGTKFTDYAPAYTYVLYAVDRIFGPAYYVHGIKFFSVLFDFGNAAVISGIVMTLRSGAGKWLGWCAFACVLWLPGVYINSAWWGQCDGIYTFFLMLSVLLLLRGRNLWTVVAFGVAFSVKLQAIFMLPLFYVLALRGYVKWRYALAIPAVYLLSCIPCALEGRSWFDLISIYFTHEMPQCGDVYANHVERYSFRFPNVYWLLGEVEPSRAVLAAICFTILAATLVVGKRVACRWAIQDRQQAIMAVAFVCFTFYPFILPCMQPRYLYSAEMLAVAMVLCYPGLWKPVFGIILVSSAAHFTECFFPLLQENWVRVEIAALIWPYAASLYALGSRLGKSQAEFRNA